ncbi:CHAT domain-containing protein [Saccharothrix luteola]|uniref:CHAT domain-containing protein n=1 Tax=Saccharothrix luteola TaxID=2893018 RepID=UPI001E3525AF|nr:CHAT domain-containing protein [Saccharothrix luteola]MCC8246634.1 CHAT domain-containing protein [Saccharothrix luteola]
MTDEVAGHLNLVSGSGRHSVVQARDIRGGVAVTVESPGSSWRAPRQLPLPVAGFVGRVPEREALDRMLDDESGAVVISALSGTAGVGKTALAVHWAHDVRDRFPDGQLYVDLRGYDAQPPVSAGEALAGFLRVLGVTAVPADPDERAALYRSLLAERRVLVLLDNARNADQVLPLLPASPSCFVLVTSRDSLPELRVRYRARRVDLGVLTLDESLTMLRDSLGDRVRQQPADAVELVNRCANLPLALRVVAETAVARPRSTLRQLAGELADGREGDVAAVISWSVRQLDEHCAAAFRLLGLHPGRDFDATALAALAGVNVEEADDLVDGLLRVHLIEKVHEQRFRMHDLLRNHARRLAADMDPIAAHLAFSRLFDHYLHLSGLAVEALAGSGVIRSSLDWAPASTTRPYEPDAAGSWIEDEIDNLAAIAAEGTRRGEYDLALGCMLRSLGIAYRLVGDLPSALRQFGHAADLLGRRLLGTVKGIALDRAATLLAAGLASQAEAVLTLHRPEFTELEAAEADHQFAIAALFKSDHDRALQLAEQARRVFVAHGRSEPAALSALVRLTAAAAAAVAVPGPLPGPGSEELSVAAELDRCGFHDAAVAARLLVVRLRIAGGDLRAAAEALGEHQREGEDAPTDIVVLRTLCHVELLVALGDPTRALAGARAALRKIDRFSGPVLYRPLLDVHDRRLTALTSQLVSSAVDPWQVLDITEQTRSAAARQVPTRAALHPALADRLTQIRFLTRAVGTTSRDDPEWDALHRRLARMRREAALLGWVEQAHHPVSPRHLAARLGERALVAFTEAWDGLLAVVLVDRTATVVRLGDAARSAEDVRELHADLDAIAPDNLPRPLVDVIAASARRRAAWLDEVLLRPLADRIADRDLVVLPTGVLHALPWSTLPSLHGRTVVVAPSATAWVERHDDDRRGDGRVVVVAGPKSAPDVTRLLRYHRRVDLLAGERARGDDVLSAMDNATLVHLAASGEHQPENTAFSAVRLHDRLVYAHEIGDLKQPPDIVLLDGADLQGGQVGTGAATLGFAGGLIKAGVRSVVVAAARTGVGTGAAAVREFHAALAQGEGPARAVATINARNPLRRTFVCIGRE